MEIKPKDRSPLALSLTIATAVVSASVLFGGSAAYADGAGEDPADDIVQTTYEIDGTDVVLNVDEAFDVPDEIQVATDDGLVDAAVVGTEITTEVAAASSCNRNWVAPFGNGWHTSVNGCAVAGTNDNTRVGYTISLGPSVGNGACFQALGSRVLGLQGQTAGFVPTYYSAGCATVPHNRSVGKTVLWGNTLQYKKIKMQANGFVSGSSGFFE